MAETRSKFQQKMRVIAKLRDAGCRSEKELNSLPMEMVLTIPGINIQDIGTILEVQKSVKTNHLFSYLTEAEKQMDRTGKTEEPEEEYDQDSEEVSENEKTDVF